MGDVGGRLPDAQPGETDEEVAPGEDAAPEAEGGIGRRTILLGAAAGAGVVAANVVPTLSPVAKAAASPAAAAVSAAVTQAAGTVDASQVNVAATGEIPQTNAQDAFSRLDTRLGKTHFIDDLRVAMTLVDDFVGSSLVSGSIGQLGWNTAGSGGTTALGLTMGPPGVFKIGSGAANAGWQNVTLGGNFLNSAPALMCEWRVKPNVLGTSSYWMGLHNGAGGDPTRGLFFRYRVSDGLSWRAVCADANNTAPVNTSVFIDTVSFHRFRIVCTGSGFAYFYIDDNLVATIPVALGTADQYSPAAMVQKTTGVTAGVLSLDYFALRWEYPR
jgi:hypothetical protein